MRLNAAKFHLPWWLRVSFLFSLTWGHPVTEDFRKQGVSHSLSRIIFLLLFCICN
jgi:hypothetical protein